MRKSKTLSEITQRDLDYVFFSKNITKKTGIAEYRKLCLPLTPKRPVIHTCFTYPILNMGDFSALYGPLGCIDSTQKVKGNSLHAEEGIGKKGKIVTIYARFINQSFLPAPSIAALALRLVFSVLIRKVKQH